MATTVSDVSISSLSIRRSELPDPWCELLAGLARRLSDETAGAVRILVWEFADRSATLTPAQARHVRAAALFDHARPAAPAVRNWLLQAAIVGLTRLVAADPRGSETRVRSLLAETDLAP